MRIAPIAAALLLFAPLGARADVPRVIAQGTAGPFEVTVLAPTPIRQGDSEWIVWVVEAAGEGSAQRPVQVEIDHDGAIVSGVSPGPVRVHVHRAGRSTARVRVGGDRIAGVIDVVFHVEPRRGATDYWRAMSIAPLGLLLFGVHQWRRRRHP